MVSKELYFAKMFFKSVLCSFPLLPSVWAMMPSFLLNPTQKKGKCLLII